MEPSLAEFNRRIYSNLSAFLADIKAIMARVEPAARARLLETYDSQTVEAIELSLPTIQMGNLRGNTLDYVLFRLSFGRLGMPRK